LSDKYFGSHEFQPRTEVVKISSDRSFGLVAAGFFALVGTLSAYNNGDRWPLWFTLAVTFAGVALAAPHTLAPLNRLWAKLGLLTHKIVSPLVLGLIFYACIVPVGWLMRMTGKDPLRLRLEPDSQSYWIHRVPPGPAPDSFKNQF
jgi:saxitoxin biosynthesis operon SxtJ-like protein